MNTDGRIPPVREVLSSFTAKLSEAQGFLQKAADTVQDTEDKNQANVLKFQRNEVISQDTPLHTHTCTQTPPQSSCQVPLPSPICLQHSLLPSMFVSMDSLVCSAAEEPAVFPHWERESVLARESSSTVCFISPHNVSNNVELCSITQGQASL